MSVNIGHGHREGHRRSARADDEAERSCTPARRHRGASASSASKLADLTPGDINTFFFTLGGAEANENAIRAARLYTGRQKIMARYRSYHGATQAHAGPHRRPAPLAQRARPPGSCT
jgi:taurine--2-oxoglutarate transaminase